MDALVVTVLEKVLSWADEHRLNRDEVVCEFAEEFSLISLLGTFDEIDKPFTMYN